MSKLSQLPDRRRIQNEAAAFIVRMDADTPLTKAERIELVNWLAASPLHRKEMASLNTFWQNTELTELIVPLDRHVEQFESHEEPVLGGWWRQPLAGFALVFVVVFCGLVGWYLPVDRIEASNGMYGTTVGKQRIVDLADGTVMQLNTNSLVEVNYDGAYRNIRLLQGQAHFTVAKNAEMPFRVYAGESLVQALGTAFTVHRHKSRKVDVIVDEGKVGLTKPARSGESDIAKPEISDHEIVHVVKAGEGVRIDSSVNDLVPLIESIDEDEMERREAWRMGFLVFSGESLEQAVLEISRYTDVSIEIPDEELRQTPIGGRFEVGKVEHMLGALEVSFDVEVERAGYNKVRLLKVER